MEKKKSFRLNTILILIISCLLMWYVLKDNFYDSIKVFASSNILWIIVCFSIYIIYFLLETLVLKKLINRHKDDYSFKSTLKLHMMTKFFNGVTPFSSGGQPLQVYELNKEGVRVTDGTTIVIQHFMIFQSSVVLLGFLAIILNTIFNVVQCKPFLNILVIIGFAINFFLFGMVFFLSVKMKISKKIVNFFIKLLAKIKVIKDPEVKINKFSSSCDDYSKSYKKLISDKKELFKLIFIEEIALIFMFMLPMFVFKALGYTFNTSIFTFGLIAIYVFMVGSFVPIPGGTGGMEYAFMGFYSYYVSNSFLSPALIMWRFIDYYIPMIIGGIFFNYETVRRNKRKRKVDY